MSPTSSRAVPHPFSDLTAGALLVLVAIALFAMRLSLPSILDDRGFYLHGDWVLDAVQNGHWIVQRNHVGDVVSKPPLYIWLAALAIVPVGRISLLTMLLPGAVATVAVAALIWRFGGELFGRRAGLLGGIGWQLDRKAGAVAGAAVHGQRSADGFHPVFQADQAGAACWICAADPVVSDRDPQYAVGRVDKDVHRGSAGMLGRVRQGLRYDVVGCHLDPLGQPRRRLHVEPDRHG